MSQLFNTLFFLWVAIWKQMIAPTFAATKDSKKPVKSVSLDDLASAPPAATLTSALDNVLMDVPKSARKQVIDATQTVIKSIRAHAKNHLEIGATCSAVRKLISKAAFSRWLYEVLERAGAARGSVYRWMDESDVLTTVIPYDVAREALVAVTDGRGIFSHEDGNTALVGAIIAALKKHPAPSKGTYEECLDWAHEVQVAFEKSTPPSKRTAGEVYKQAMNLYKRILNGGKGITANRKLAVEFAVAIFNELYIMSEPLATVALDGMEAIADNKAEPLAEIGTRAMKALEAAQKAPKVTKDKGTVLMKGSIPVAKTAVQ